MLKQLAKESLLVFLLTTLLVALAATAGLPSRPTNVQADAASPNVAAKAPPEALERRR